MCEFAMQWNEVWPALAGAKTWLWRDDRTEAIAVTERKKNVSNCQQSALPRTLCLIGLGGQLDHTRQNYLTRPNSWASKSISAVCWLTSVLIYICISYTRLQFAKYAPVTRASCHTHTHTHTARTQYCRDRNDYARHANHNMYRFSILWQFPKFRMLSLRWLCARARSLA